MLFRSLNIMSEGQFLSMHYTQRLRYVEELDSRINGTGNINQNYIAEGLTVNLPSDLARIRDIFIVSLNSSMAYKDKPVTPLQIANELGVLLNPSPPIILMDMAGAILDIALAEILAEGDRVFIASMQYTIKGVEAAGNFIILPNPGLLKLMPALDKVAV